ncbi:MAG: ABC transporter permease [Methylobacteriaceae bacterium]|nr:ABC transporter permease [Methylobacteriaceae bacterium]
MLAAFLLVAFGVPLLPIYEPYEQDLMASLAEPFARAGEKTYWLGADALGRDYLSRLSLAARVSLGISVVAVGISLVMGVALGLVAGFFRGPIEAAIMGLGDLQLAIPRVLLLIASAAVFGSSIGMLMLLLGLTSWVTYGRLARAMALSLREREFVLAALTQGASSSWNIRRHLLPNVAPNMAIIASFEFGQVVVLEASLSYLGLGVQPPLPSLGLMINEGQLYLEINPWISILPGLVIFALVAGSQFVSQRFTPENRGAGLSRVPTV